MNKIIMVLMVLISVGMSLLLDNEKSKCYNEDGEYVETDEIIEKEKLFAESMGVLASCLLIFWAIGQFCIIFS